MPAMKWRRVGIIFVVELLTLAVLAVPPAKAQSMVASDASVHQANHLHRSADVAPRLASNTASVTVTAATEGRRLVVVDGEDRIVAIWSNTTALNPSLVVRSMDGTERAITDGVLHQYQGLLEEIDWTQRGLVYSLVPETR